MNDPRSISNQITRKGRGGAPVDRKGKGCFHRAINRLILIDSFDMIAINTGGLYPYTTSSAVLESVCGENCIIGLTENGNDANQQRHFKNASPPVFYVYIPLCLTGNKRRVTSLQRVKDGPNKGGGWWSRIPPRTFQIRGRFLKRRKGFSKGGEQACSLTVVYRRYSLTSTQCDDEE